MLRNDLIRAIRDIPNISPESILADESPKDGKITFEFKRGKVTYHGMAYFTDDLKRIKWIELFRLITRPINVEVEDFIRLVNEINSEDENGTTISYIEEVDGFSTTTRHLILPDGMYNKDKIDRVFKVVLMESLVSLFNTGKVLIEAVKNFDKPESETHSEND
ncbi:hypothetical protein [Citrobacter sp. RHB21-C01]|uniref:hypothetical protein n=1 Tax=Citrobacter sp. RHB21-C01 TaxID=2742622 RepID=UPI0034D5D024